MTDDTPLWSEELSGDRHTIRATVDETSDGTLYSVLAIEPNDGNLMQMLMTLDRHGWLRLADMAEHAVRVIDRHERKAAA